MNYEVKKLKQKTTLRNYRNRLFYQFLCKEKVAWKVKARQRVYWQLTVALRKNTNEQKLYDVLKPFFNIDTQKLRDSRFLNLFTKKDQYL